MRRKIILIGILLSLILVPFTTQVSARGHRSYVSHSSYSSHHRNSYHSGYYAGGRSSSHKGGQYRNSSTNNHYRKRK